MPRGEGEGPEYAHRFETLRDSLMGDFDHLVWTAKDLAHGSGVEQLAPSGETEALWNKLVEAGQAVQRELELKRGAIDEHMQSLLEQTFQALREEAETVFGRKF